MTAFPFPQRAVMMFFYSVAEDGLIEVARADGDMIHEPEYLIGSKEMFCGVPYPRLLRSAPGRIEVTEQAVRLLPDWNAQPPERLVYQTADGLIVLDTRGRKRFVRRSRRKGQTVTRDQLNRRRDPGR